MPTRPTLALPLPSRSLLACASTGLALGQGVFGIAAQHQGSAYGLVTAWIFVLAAAAALTCVLCHLHRQPATGRQRPARAPLQAWLLTLGAALLASLHAGPWLAG